MARVKIEDLVVRQTLDKKAMKKIFGGVLQIQGNLTPKINLEINAPNQFANNLSGLVNAYADTW